MSGQAGPPLWRRGRGRALGKKFVPSSAGDFTDSARDGSDGSLLTWRKVRKVSGVPCRLPPPRPRVDEILGHVLFSERRRTLVVLGGSTVPAMEI